jgi:YYY domain-containing protein
MVTRIAVLPATVAFNLGNAGWFALVAVQAYGIVYDLLAQAELEDRSILRPLLAPLMLLVTGNGEGLLEVLHARGYFPAGFWKWLDIGRLSEPPQPPFTSLPQRFFWWWQASRTLRDRTPWGEPQEVIDEFPAFSFLLGDMHPHLLALPFVLVAIALALHVYYVAAERSEPTRLAPRLAPLVGYAVVLGALGFLNTWDFPIYWMLFVGAMVLGRYGHAPKSVKSFFGTLWRAAPEAGILGVLSVVLYVPFWAALRSQAGGILPNLFNATRPQQFVVMFLPLLVPLGGVVVGAARERGVRWHLALGLGIVLMVAIALAGLMVGAVAAYPYLLVILRGESVQGYSLAPETALAAIRQRLGQPWTGLALAIGVAVVLLALLQLRRHDESVIGPEHKVDEIGFPLLLALFGLLLTLAPEFVYLQDVFMTRMNTIFKFYFQAWVLWSLAGAWQMCRWFASRRGPTVSGVRMPALAVAMSVLLTVVGLVYTVLAVPARAREQGIPWTLDGAAWLVDAQPQDAQAIAWLNATIEGAPVIVEAPGDQHRAYIYEGRVSALTGLPTILGWGGHQWQWRGNYDEPALREVALDVLFTTQDRSAAEAILQRYDVSYIYIGPTERQRYATEADQVGLDKFREMYPAVYNRDGVVIYKVAEE